MEYSDQLTQLAYLLISHALVHGIAFDEVVFQNLTSPDAESCAALALYTIANGNDNIKVV